MAGICGIIEKSVKRSNHQFSDALQLMLFQMKDSSEQIEISQEISHLHFGTIIPLNSEVDNFFVSTREKNIQCIIDGQVYIPDEIKCTAINKYSLDKSKNENQLIPYIYSIHGIDFVKNISGSFSIFLVDFNKNKVILVNDHLGFLPLFYYQNANYFIFSSRLESILASGLIDRIEIDKVSIAEYLTFNYILSDSTLIKNILQFPAASLYIFDLYSLAIKEYWSPEIPLSQPSVPKKESLEIIDDALKTAISKPFRDPNKKIGITLTGGWDGRLIFSYILNKHRDNILAFSFGAAHSQDINIPKKIAHLENFSYTPFILDEKYMKNSFLDAAVKTISYSNGMRSYRRTHYFYTLRNMGANTDIFISGNFGDELLKFAKIKPCAVISDQLISYVASNFSNRPTISGILQLSPKQNFFETPKLIEEWNSRLLTLEKGLSNYDTISQKFHHLKISRIANRYFGNEVGSYNDYIQNYSPFLNIDFITAFSRSFYSGNLYPFNGNRLAHKQMSSKLYTKLIERNADTLLSYETDRGFTLSDLGNPIGKIKVLYKKSIGKPIYEKDPYFLKSADNRFDNYLKTNYNESNTSYIEDSLLNIARHDPNSNTDLLFSLVYWISNAREKFNF